MNFALLTTGGSEDMLASYSPLLLLAVMGVALYFLMIRPNKKKEKQATDMRNSIEIGDEVTTIGGIVGRVASIKEDTFVIETAGERSRMRFKRWAIQDVNKLNMDGGSEIEAPPAEKKGLFGFGGKKKDSSDDK